MAPGVVRAGGPDRIRAANLKRRTSSLGVTRSRAHSISRTAGVHSLPSGGSAISAKNRYISPAVGAVLRLQPLGDIDPEIVADHIR